MIIVKNVQGDVVLKLDRHDYFLAEIEHRDLRNAVFNEEYLVGGEFIDCAMRGSHFHRAKPSCDFVRCDMCWSNFNQAHVAGSFVGCDLRCANFRDVAFASVVFIDCNLEGADFRGSKLLVRSIGFSGTDYTKAIWDEDMETAEIKNLDGEVIAALKDKRFYKGKPFCKASLMGMDLRRADFRDADMLNANLRDAQLDGADFSGADLREAAYNMLYLQRVAQWDWHTLFEHEESRPAYM